MLLKTLTFTLLYLVANYSFAEYYGDQRRYEITVTNITGGQTFTPILAATHKSAIRFFELGNIAIGPLEVLAESGDIAPLRAILDSSDLVDTSVATEGLLLPGNTISFEISGRRHSRVSFAAMLIPTNDTFVSLNSVKLPRYGSRSYFAKAYDAGTEVNDELCANIPGPACGGEGTSDGDGEGYVHISAGIHGEGDLAASNYDWRDAVAKVVVRRIY